MVDLQHMVKDMSDEERRQWIVSLNDHLRRSGQTCYGATTISTAFNDVSDKVIEQLMNLVRDFKDFDPAFDNNGLHEAGEIELDGLKAYWEIIYHDDRFQHLSGDPEDVTLTFRELTLHKI